MMQLNITTRLANQAEYHCYSRKKLQEGKDSHTDAHTDYLQSEIILTDSVSQVFNAHLHTRTHYL